MRALFTVAGGYLILDDTVLEKPYARLLDVHFVNPLPVMQRPAYRVWADTRHGRIVEAESLPTLVPVVVDGVCD